MRKAEPERRRYASDFLTSSPFHFPIYSPAFMDTAAHPTLTLARELIALRSQTPDDAGCQALLQKRLAPLGFACDTLTSNGVTNLWHGAARRAP